MMVTETARAAILDGGTAGLLTLAGGSLRVALFRKSVEVTGNGYSRKTISTFDNASNGSNETAADGADVVFSASGGNIVFDQLKVYNRRGTVLYAESAISSPVTIAPGGPATMTVRFRIPASIAAPGGLDTLGCELAYSADTDPEIVAKGTRNAQIIQGHWQTRGNPYDLHVPCGYWPITGSLDDSGINADDDLPIQGYGRGMTWEGGGTQPLAEIQYAEDIGLDAARFCVTDRAQLTDDVFWYMQTYGGQYRGAVNIQGITDRLLRQNIIDAAASRPGVAIRVMPNAGAGVGTGKPVFQRLTVMSFLTGLQVGDPNNDEADNADQFVLHDFRAFLCDVGIELVGKQSVDCCLTGHFEGIDCATMFQTVKGGKLRCNSATLIRNGGTLLNIGATQSAAANFHIENLTVDLNAGTTAKLLTHSGGGGQKIVTFGNVHFDPVTTLVDGLCPGSYTNVTIHRAANVPARLFRPQGGTDLFPISFTLENFTMQDSMTVDQIVSTSQNGAWTFTARGVHDQNNRLQPDYQVRRSEAGVVTVLDGHGNVP